MKKISKFPTKRTTKVLKTKMKRMSTKVKMKRKSHSAVLRKGLTLSQKSILKSWKFQVSRLNFSRKFKLEI